MFFKYLRILIIILFIFPNIAEAKKHRLLMDMFEVGVVKYTMRHEAKNVAKRIRMVDGRKVSLDELKVIIREHRRKLNALSKEETAKKFGLPNWRSPHYGAKNKWTGERGESYYIPNDAEYMARTKGKGVLHYNTHPYFNNKETSYMTMRNPTGDSEEDIKQAYKDLGDIIGKRKSYINNIFNNEEITLHHTPDGRSLINVDRYVHGKVPHSGGSYFNRMKDKGLLK